METLMEAAAAGDVAIEISAQPERLDLDWASVKEYRDTVEYVISTDAHTTGEPSSCISPSHKRAGGCEANNTLNTRSVDDLWCFLDSEPLVGVRGIAKGVEDSVSP